MVYHYFSEVGIWTSLGKDENVISRPNTKMGTIVPNFVRNRDAC